MSFSKILPANKRYQATAIHFIISVFIFSALFLVLIHNWYPAPYFSASGGWQGIAIVAAIDVVLGPLLTLIIFNVSKPKKELVMDLGVIAALQIAALCWGIYTVYNQRPLAITFVEEKFYSVSAEHFTQLNIKPEVLEQHGDSYPVFIYIQFPVTRLGLQIFRKKLQEDNLPPNLQPELYEPVSEHYDDIFRHSVDIQKYMDGNPELKSEINDLLKQTGTRLEDNYYMTLESSFSDILLVFDKSYRQIGYASSAYRNKQTD